MSTASGSASIMDAHVQDKISLDSIKKAAERIKGHVHNTPMLTCSYLDSLVGDGKELFFKCENFQKTGSFKVCGAPSVFYKKTISNNTLYQNFSKFP